MYFPLAVAYPEPYSIYMLEAIENETEMQLMCAVQGQKDCDIRLAIRCRIDDLQSNQVEPITYTFQGDCWTAEVRGEVADRLKIILNTHYTIELGY